jgi:hypothetical protein
VEKHKAAVKELNGVFRPIIIGAVPQLLAMRCSSCATEQLSQERTTHGRGWTAQEWRGDFVRSACSPTQSAHSACLCP